MNEIVYKPLGLDFVKKFVYIYLFNKEVELKYNNITVNILRNTRLD